jgi:acyl CoA:acetate/3-ketoacid CoA transferase beta subunit
VTNLGVLDFGGPGHRMRLVGVHPGVTVDDVIAATGFELAVADDVEDTRPPSPAESEVIARLDPNGMRYQEVPG